VAGFASVAVMVRTTASARILGMVALVVAVLVGALASPASARRGRFTVTSPAFRGGQPIPKGFTCDGAGTSLPLAWRNLPKGTKQLAVVMDDPDAPVRTFVHWVAWGIRPRIGRLPEETLPAGVIEGRTYLGPCPPRGSSPHHYRVTMYALDAPPILAAGNVTAHELRAAVNGHVLARDRLVGTYAR
jgi:Raf kinase inhibitor-like YbhB/YbcL family protein